MRDGTVLGMIQGVNGAVAHDVQLLHRLLVLNECRMNAIENIIHGRRFGLLRAMLLQFVSPVRFVRMLDAEQRRLFDAENEAMLKRLSQPQIKKVDIIKP